MTGSDSSADLLVFRRLSDPSVPLNIPRQDVPARIAAGELDLEDELFRPASQTWVPLWRAARGIKLPPSWGQLMEQHQSDLDHLKTQIRSGKLSYSDYIKSRELLRTRISAGESNTIVAGGSRPHNFGSDFDRLPEHIRTSHQFVQKLGEGGGGSVSLWRNTYTGVQVAIKITKPEFKNHIQNELRQLESIRSPNVVHVRTYGPLDAQSERWFIVFDYVPGPTLAEHIRREHALGKLDAETTMNILLGIAQGLADLHRAGVVHRDLKPANIILKETSSGKPMPVLIDLGMARSGTRGQTVIGGTAGYESPEQQSGQSCTPASDIFCFGLIAYELVTGKRLTGTRHRLLHEACPGLPDGLDHLVKEMCTVDDPQDRLPNGSVLRDKLDRLRHARPTSPRPTHQAQTQPQPRATELSSQDQYELGVCHANGTGVAQDDAEAVKRYRLAAEQGHTKDDAEAMKWYHFVFGGVIGLGCAIAMWIIKK